MQPETIALFAESFCAALNRLLPGWSVRAGVIHGPEDAAVRFSTEHQVTSPGHADVEFSFQDSDPASLRLMDCVVGFGDGMEKRAENAATIWISTSATALLELKYSRKGQYADHYMASDPAGLTGWHSICSSIIGWGEGDGGKALQQWWVSSGQVLPALAPALVDLQGDRPHAIKIFFGGADIAEVRVDGQHHDAASAALLALDWPRQPRPDFVRALVIALHRE